MYGTKQDRIKTYDEDITPKLWKMADKEVEDWANATANMSLRLTNHPDPTKPEPSYLIAKLNRRETAMREHLKVRKNIQKSYKSSVNGNGNALESVMLAASVKQTNAVNGCVGSTKTSQEIWDYAAPSILSATHQTSTHMPPPHLRKESTHLTIDERIQKEGEIDVDKEKFIINENGV